MDEYLTNETTAATPEVSPFVGSLSNVKLALLSLALVLFLLAGPFPRLHLISHKADSDLVTFFTQRKSRLRGDALLIAGPPHSGKTAILSNVSLHVSAKHCTLMTKKISWPTIRLCRRIHHCRLIRPK